MLYTLVDIYEIKKELGVLGEAPNPGEKIHLAGGYFHEPDYLRESPEGYTATVVKYIPGQNNTDALVAKLDQPLSGNGSIGSYVTLKNRYTNAKWCGEGIVQVELCNFEPEDTAWEQRRKGVWIESAATYKVVDGV